MTPLIGFAPDLDPASPGVIADCQQIIPTVRGFAAEKALTVISSALPATSYGMATVLRQDGTRREIAGTLTRLYELSGTSWTDVSKSGGYSNVNNRWRFAEFGNATLATNGADSIQVSNSAGSAFAALGSGSVNAPAAQIIETVAGFAMAFNTNDAPGSPSYGYSPDRWWCSALYDHTNWTPSVTTQCATGRFIDAPGPITAAKKLGDNVVVYKDRAMFIGTYQGPPIIWAWTQVSSEVGAISPDAVVNIGTAHIFFGADHFWMFDGSRPVQIDNPIREWFLANSASASRNLMQATYDRKNGLVRFYFSSAGNNTGSLDRCIVYHIPTNRWGKADQQIETVSEIILPGVTYDGFGSFNGGSWTWDTLPSIIYDSDTFSSQFGLPGVIDTSHRLNSMTGVPASSMILTGTYGDDNIYSSLKRIRCRFTVPPASGSVVTSFRSDSGVPFSTTTKTANLNGAKFDVLQQGRWHRGQFTFNGNVELSAIEFQLAQRGLR